MHVVGTAGHVDHGKSTLVQALTGIDPDRLQEEKDRGMTIDLGFAWLTMPSGREVSIVDVPGHERFIKNMLAGVGGIDLALLVIAADESVMPQTREHLAILDLLQVRRGLAVITKRDLVDDEVLQLVQMEVEDVLKGTTLEEAMILAVSATTRQGLDELMAAMDQALDDTAQRSDLGRPRLAIDRAFTVAGFGTVVTGTLIDGILTVGQEVELVLSGRRSRIRGLQTHRRKLEQAEPGSRVAVNLIGLSPSDIVRGEVLSTPGWLRPTQALDARVHLLEEVPKAARHNLPVTFHAHTIETPAKLRLLDRDELEPGQGSWTQLLLTEPVALVRGDRFVVRSADATLGGGVVVDVHARRHRRRHAPTLDRLDVLAQGTPTAQLTRALEGREPASVATLARLVNLSEQEAVELVQTAQAEGTLVVLGQNDMGSATLLYTAASWSRLSTKVHQLLGDFHQQQPLRQGMPREELRNRLGLTGQAGAQAFQHLAQVGAMVDKTGVVLLPGHQVAVSPEQQRRMDSFIQALEKDPFSSAMELDGDLIELLAEQGRVVKAADGILFATGAYLRMKDTVVAHLQGYGSVTVAQVRDMLGTSRKYALALLEHMDDDHITRRTGDERVLLQR
jgi:selenocysteine-specific elongation factor